MPQVGVIASLIHGTADLLHMRRTGHALPRTRCHSYKPSSCRCRTSARTKGTYELLQHIQANAKPVIARQVECVLKHWRALELAESAVEDWEAEMTDQEDDDLQDAHTNAGDGLDEAESVHSWGHALHLSSLLHASCVVACRWLPLQVLRMRKE